MRIRLALAASALAAICLPAAVSAQAGGTGGQKIQAKPGDLILVEHTDRVRVIRRSEAQVRAIYNAQQRWLVLLVDYASRGADPDELLMRPTDRRELRFLRIYTVTSSIVLVVLCTSAFREANEQAAEHQGCRIISRGPALQGCLCQWLVERRI